MVRRNTHHPEYGGNIQRNCWDETKLRRTLQAERKPPFWGLKMSSTESNTETDATIRQRKKRFVKKRSVPKLTFSRIVKIDIPSSMPMPIKQEKSSETRSIRSIPNVKVFDFREAESELDAALSESGNSSRANIFSHHTALVDTSRKRLEHPLSEPREIVLHPLEIERIIPTFEGNHSSSRRWITKNRRLCDVLWLVGTFLPALRTHTIGRNCSEVVRCTGWIQASLGKFQGATLQSFSR